MSTFILEIMSEEIPARMQKPASTDLMHRLQEELARYDINFNILAQKFSTPRRIAVKLENVPQNTPTQKQQKKGPRTNAPAQALAGFLKNAGLESIEQCDIESDKKGEYYVANLETKSQRTTDILTQILPNIIESFTWPKSMRSHTSAFRWVRPLTSILCMLDEEIVKFEINGIQSSNQTLAPRTYTQEGTNPQAISLTHADGYENLLHKMGIEGNANNRMIKIKASIDKICTDNQFIWQEDNALLEEVAGLVETPLALLGAFDKNFLTLPKSIIRLSMRTHQKYFALNNKAGELVSHFIVIANQHAPDGGKAIITGNQRVLRARLHDAQFFLEQDLKTSLDAQYGKLAMLVFHQKLGTLQDKVKRIKNLSKWIATQMELNPPRVEQAAGLCKSDLVSQTVIELPSLQGEVGGYLARQQGKDEEICTAIAQHYRPQSIKDDIPSTPLGQALALADKMDSLAGFWSINEKPTGSKDPYALRRAALSVIRILKEGNILIPLWHLVGEALKSHNANDEARVQELTGFIVERLNIYMRDHENMPYDVVRALTSWRFSEDHNQHYTYSKSRQDYIVTSCHDMLIFNSFLQTPEGNNLYLAYKRAVGILKSLPPEDYRQLQACAQLLKPVYEPERAEKELLEALRTATTLMEDNMEDSAQTSYQNILNAFAQLRTPIDNFFETVQINTPNSPKRQYRLGLLYNYGVITSRLANFEELEG